MVSDLRNGQRKRRCRKKEGTTVAMWVAFVPSQFLDPGLGLLQMKGTAGAPCTHGTGSPQGLERNIWKWVTGGSFEKDELEMKLLVRFLSCNISNIAVNLPLKNLF